MASQTSTLGDAYNEVSPFLHWRLFGYLFYSLLLSIFQGQNCMPRSENFRVHGRFCYSFFSPFLWRFRLLI
jgi:hypothetical protein